MGAVAYLEIVEGGGHIRAVWETEVHQQLNDFRI